MWTPEHSLGQFYHLDACTSPGLNLTKRYHLTRPLHQYEIHQLNLHLVRNKRSILTSNKIIRTSLDTWEKRMGTPGVTDIMIRYLGRCNPSNLIG